DVTRAGLAQHQPFAAESLDTCQLGAESFDPSTHAMLMNARVRRARGVKERAAVCESLLKRRVKGRGVEHDEGDLLPLIALVLPPHDAHRALEVLSAAPQLAVEWDV